LVYLGALGVLPTLRPAFYGLFRWVFADSNHWKAFDFHKDMAQVDEKLAPILNAMNPDLRRFSKRGGKLILYHGWADAITSAQDTINYYNRVVSLQDGLTPIAVEETRKFARLFLAPGMAHCVSGPGPSVIFAANTPGGPQNDPERDALVA